MTTKNKYWIVAGSLNLLTFFLHLIGGQLDLVDPMLDTTLPIEKASQLIGAWHMVTIILFATSYVLISAGLGKQFSNNTELIKLVAYLNLSFCLPFILTGFYYGILVPQWVFFLPIAVFTIMGLKKNKGK